MVECRICNREIAGSNLDRGYFASRSSQPSIPPGSVNEYQLQLGKQRQEWLIPLADETQGVQVKLCYPLTMRAVHERLKRCFVWSRRYTNRLHLPLPFTFSILRAKRLRHNGVHNNANYKMLRSIDPLVARWCCHKKY